jgi:hypothetical protein
MEKGDITFNYTGGTSGTSVCSWEGQVKLHSWEGQVYQYTITIKTFIISDFANTALHGT